MVKVKKRKKKNFLVSGFGSGSGSGSGSCCSITWFYFDNFFYLVLSYEGVSRDSF